MTAGQASADITLPNNYEDAKEAYDGDDYYSFTFRKRDDWDRGVSAVLWRQSVATGSKRRIASFSAAHGVISQLEAGGGRVVVGLQKFTGRKIRSRIVVMNRDGSAAAVLAKGLAGNPLIDYPYNPCGKFPWVEDVTSGGAVVLAESNEVKRGSECRYKSSVRNWRYVEIAPDGRQRVIDSGKYTPGLQESTDLWNSVHAEGDYAALVTDAKLRVYLKNLETGVTTGPFVYPAQQQGKLTSGVWISQNTDGVLAVGSETNSGRLHTHWTDVFMNPLDPRSSARSKEFYEVEFCGSRLVTFDYKEHKKSSVKELDPATLKPIGTLAKAGAYEWIQSCSATHLVVAREDGLVRTVLHSIALAS